MNYFERLIRRALLETPARIGDAVHDPFGEEAPLQLDTPTQQPASPWPERQSVRPTENRTVLNNTELREHSIERETQTTHEVTPAPVLSVPREGARATPAAQAPTEVLAPAMPTPLAYADVFMSSLGVAMPSTEAPAAVQIIAGVQVPVAAPSHRAERTLSEPVNAAPKLPHAKPQTMQPPRAPAPSPQRSRAAEKEVTRSPGPAARTLAPSERPTHNPPAPEVVRETLVVVKATESQSRHASLQGAAAPTFGAGQL